MVDFENFFEPILARVLAHQKTGPGEHDPIIV